MKYKILCLLLILIVLSACKKENDPTLFSLSVTVVPENSGFVPNYSDTLIEKNTNVKLNAVPEEGFAFTNWEGNISSTDNPLEFTITDHTELVANFVKKTYPLTIITEGEGIITETIIKSKTDYEHGTKVQLEAIPDTGWTFKRWEGDLAGNDSSRVIVTVTSEISVTAIFEKSSYPLNIIIEGEGKVEETILKSKTDYEYGTVVQLKAFPDSTWIFRRWEGDLNGEDDTVELTVTSEMNVKAIFEEGTVDYCLPITLDGYAHQTNGDSVHFMDYDFKYDGQFLSSYTKIYNYTKGSIDKISAFFKTTYTYENNVVHQIVENNHFKSGDLWASYDYVLGWQGDQLASLDYEYFVGNQTGEMKSTKIEYEEPCGLSFFEFEGIDYGVQISQSTEFMYSNNCLTYEITKYEDGIRTFENQQSIFKDVLGMNGFIGNRYEHMFSFFQPIPLYNKDNLRLTEVINSYINPDNVQRETLTENYVYESFIVDQDYSRYFSRITTDSKDGTETRDSFVVKYSCQYK